MATFILTPHKQIGGNQRLVNWDNVEEAFALEDGGTNIQFISGRSLQVKESLAAISKMVEDFGY